MVAIHCQTRWSAFPGFHRCIPQGGPPGAPTNVRCPRSHFQGPAPKERNSQPERTPPFRSTLQRPVCQIRSGPEPLQIVQAAWKGWFRHPSPRDAMIEGRVDPSLFSGASGRAELISERRADGQGPPVPAHDGEPLSWMHGKVRGAKIVYGELGDHRGQDQTHQPIS
jgi:hypothetical protein